MYLLTKKHFRRSNKTTKEQITKIRTNKSTKNLKFFWRGSREEMGKKNEKL